MSVTIIVNQNHPERATLSTRTARRGTVLSVDPFVRETVAENLRVGRQVDTPDGWQTIIGTLISQDTDQVVIWTEERPDDDQHGLEGWQRHFGDPVRTRLQPIAEQGYQQQRRARLEKRRLKRLAMAAASCPAWCVEHYDAGEGMTKRNHAAAPDSVNAANCSTDEPIELGFWLERRDDKETGATETVGVIELKTLDDVELTPAALRLLSQKLMSLADRAEMHGS